MPRAALENAIQKVDINSVAASNANLTKISIDSKTLKIGQTETNLYQTDAVTKIPDITFYDVPQHLVLLEHLLQVSHDN